MTEDGVDFIVTEGARTLEKQRSLVAKGASKTMKSRHIPEMNQCGEACAIDLAVRIDGEVRWDWPLYAKLAEIVKEAAHIEGIPIEAGADWVKFRDGPHFQLPWSKYP
jgi:peptidoglycan L-alanyl-D-glutamate endopeptidase CwlK